jgi:formamidopyrimidine-DNA glycosylase
MPELPEVEQAAAIARATVVGRRITSVALLHHALARRTPPLALRALAGAIIERVVRRGKHQLLELDDGRTIHVHFRMAGDWSVSDASHGLPRYARASIDLSDGQRLVLVDPRALSTLTVHAPGVSPLPPLGPEPSDPSLTAATLGIALARRRGPIKPVLLDQGVVAGVGNIYACEALWHARISPRAKASGLGAQRLDRLLRAVRKVLGPAARLPGRYRDTPVSARLAVYDRERKPCRRCRRPISRIVQAGRSTYFCRSCQRT